ncbi:LacI family transcriptional regulator [Evansella vedderi]|uniref:LacI family transcriptional regulator n=1 Tax=Evansella vedderi TaxID=38282 RepID=A0ABT9ZQH5_9BACI|nr:LacI family DNA-binding transcriptional regulator [Evansella vedderi]MDQ0253205.1 LacI family transcriptional regulator [Evansella vedderi]
MNTLVKRSDVAKLAGVSEATVSRVLNNVGPIREETKNKVLQAAKALNYQPNSIAQCFARGKSGNIGVIVPSFPKVHMLSTYYFSEILSGIGRRLGESNYSLLLVFQPPDQPKNYVQLFQSQKIDGCIILGAKNHESDKEALIHLHHLDLPFIVVNQTYLDYPFHTIDAEHYEGSYKAVSYLINKGFRNIAFVNGSNDFSNSSERFAAYKDALKKAGIEPMENWIFQGNYSRSSGIKIAKEIAPLIPQLDAIFAANDRMAIGLMQGLSELGYKVGKDFALIGYDDSDIASMVNPPLTSVKVPLFDMGKIAAEKIIQMLNHEITEQIHIRLPVTLKERASCCKQIT